ncbi:MAG: hypothetical protein Ct9H300mP27_11450 [Chloroflexota bacterium]|nr:MAG: hypothetical protein Ct9H300mP27_11450 [Chloroflexota bacterium]
MMGSYSENILSLQVGLWFWRTESLGEIFCCGSAGQGQDDQTTPEHHARIKRTAENYSRKAQLFKSEGL